LRDLVHKHLEARPRAHVMAAYRGSHEKFGTFYNKLAGMTDYHRPEPPKRLRNSEFIVY
jgi:hypothetical protein